jgi:hypothetical protein
MRWGLSEGEQPMQTMAKLNGPAVDQAAVVSAFLKGVLAGGAVAVADLEVRARAAGLIGERQRITDAKVIKRAKKELGINSRRDGFGRGGEWSWALPTRPSIELADTPAELAPKTATQVVCGEDNPRLERRTPPNRRSANTPTETTPRRPIPADWEMGVARLHHQRRPAGMLQHAWQLFLDDCEHFLGHGWAERAAELRWDSVALFGSDPKRPADQAGAGLVWRLAGGTITAIYTDWATYRANGTEGVFHRRPASPNIAVPWQFR